MRKTGYDFLNDMVQIKSESSMNITNQPHTARVNYIITELRNMGLEFVEDVFSITKDGSKKRINIYVPFFVQDRKKAQTVTFTAHHDIVNSESQNCQDNTTSVCNLLHFCNLLKGKELTKNIVICFLDGEECGMFGSKRMAQKIKRNHLPFVKCNANINLELTGVGSHVWADFDNISGYRAEQSTLKQVIEQRVKNVNSTTTPGNDSVMFRTYGIDSFCIGLWNDKDLQDRLNGHCPDTWMLCHRLNDTIDKVSANDMTKFVETTLINLVV